MAGNLIEVLQQSDLLSNLPTEVLGPLAETASIEQYDAGDLIFETGADDDTLYVIRKGVIEIRQHSAGQLLATMRAGQSFGELAAFDSQPRSAAAVARTDTELVGVTRASLVHVFEESPGALMSTVSNLARSLTSAKEQVTLINRFLEDKVRERTEEVRETQLEIIRRLGTAAEFRDDVTGAHIYRMSQYCAVVARGAGLNDEEAEHLLVAAPMHDIGKIGVPDDILNKPGRLTEEEFATMRAHTTWGAQILDGSNSSWIKLARRVALEHHEHWNGKGYPHGLKGEEISLEARICAVADVFDALTSVRPYKDGWPFERAFNLIMDEAGTQFDPDLVQVFATAEPTIRRIHAASLEGQLKADAWRDADPDSAASLDDPSLEALLVEEDRDADADQRPADTADED